jgi:hypothetical protein
MLFSVYSHQLKALKPFPNTTLFLSFYFSSHHLIDFVLKYSIVGIPITAIVYRSLTLRKPLHVPHKRDITSATFVHSKVIYNLRTLFLYIS